MPRLSTIALPMVAAGALLAPNCGGCKPGPSPDPGAAAWEAFDRELSSRLIGRDGFAASVAVTVDGEIVHTGVYGVRVPPPAEPEPVEPSDRFRLASISKIITATVVLQLVEAGLLQQDEPVGVDLVQQVGATPADPAVEAIKVRQLLSHTAEFASYQTMFFNGSFDSCTAAAGVGLSAPLAHPPGTYYTYSDLNFCLLGMLIEQAAGGPYQDVVRELLLEPLGSTGMRLAATFDTNESEVVHRSIPGRNYMEALGAAGAWTATATDVVRIVDSLDTSNLGFHPLSAEMAELMRNRPPAPVVSGTAEWYGLGLLVYADETWGHTGTLESTHTMVLRRPDGVTWSVLVSGKVPSDSAELRRIFDESITAAGVVL